MAKKQPSLHNDIKWVATAMQLLAMFPVQNVRETNADFLQFRFTSAGFCYFTFCWSCVTTLAIIYFMLMISTEYGVQIWSIGKTPNFKNSQISKFRCSSYCGNVGRFVYGFIVFKCCEKLAEFNKKMETDGEYYGKI